MPTTCSSSTETHRSDRRPLHRLASAEAGRTRPGIAGTSGELVRKLIFGLHGVPAYLQYLRLRWEGLEHVPKRGPAVLVANHTSMLDGSMLSLPPFVARGFRRVRFLAGRDQVEGPFGPFLRLFEAIPITQGAGDLTAFREAARVLAGGHLLGVFPEGGISRDGRMNPFHEGAAWIALRSGAPIVPVTINGSFQAWPRSAAWPRPGRVSVVYHPPIHCAELRERRYEPPAVAELTAELRAIVASRYREPEAGPGGGPGPGAPM